MEKENTKEFVISRTFNAARSLVFKACTEAEHLMRWWGPKGMSIQVTKLDVRPRGVFHYKMEAPNGAEMWGVFKYREINAPEKIVFTNAFSDKDGNLTRNPFAPTWPLEVLNTWTFTEENGKTTITLRGGPINSTTEEQKIFTDNFAGMEQGFGGTFDQLEEYLIKIK